MGLLGIILENLIGASPYTGNGNPNIATGADRNNWSLTVHFQDNGRQVIEKVVDTPYDTTTTTTSIGNGHNITRTTRTQKKRY